MQRRPLAHCIRLLNTVAAASLIATSTTVASSSIAYWSSPLPPQRSRGLQPIASASERRRLLDRCLYKREDLGPYTLDFTSSGRYMARAGRKGHLAIIDMNNLSLIKEFHEHGAILKLQFLKNHFLLASINKFGRLHYQDVTTGFMVGNYRTGQGRSDVMQVNPFNGVVALGHSTGTVSMWKPTSSAPLIKMLCSSWARFSFGISV